LEKRVAELTKDKEMLQAMIEKLQAQMSKLLEMM
jgi:prefoldin subunit 5